MPPPEERFRERALRVLLERGSAALAASAAAASRDVSQLLEEQGALERRRAALAAQLAPLRGEREGLEQHSSSLGAASVALEAWLAENEPRVADPIDPDAALQPADAWGRQALQAGAEDAAVEDCLYALAGALEKGRLPLDLYLRLVRQLCREQFMARATGLVVAAAQGAHAHASGSRELGGVAPQPPPLPKRP